MTRLPARTGWAWLKQGAALFRKQPAALTTLLFANILISILISAVPVAGTMLALMLIPCFSMAFMQACLMIDQGQRVTPVVLLTGFKSSTMPALLKVGLMYVAVSLVLTLISRYAVDPSFWQQVQVPLDPKAAPAFSGADMLAVLMIFLIEVAALMALCFAAPLTYWQQMGPGKAIFYSFFAVLRAARVFVVLFASWFAAFFAVCFVVTLLLGPNGVARVVILWLIFLFVLLLQCAMYAGYRAIFGTPTLAGPVKTP